MNDEIKCKKCNDTGIDHGKICTCVLKRKINKFLPIELRNSTFKNYLSVVESLRDVNILFVTSSDRFNSVCKAFLISEYVRSKFKMTCNMVSGKDVIDLYLDNNRLIEDMISLDMLIFKLGYDPNNKLMPGLLEYIVKNRMDRQKYTWVFFNTKKFKETARMFYGDGFFDIITSSKFKRVQK